MDQLQDGHHVRLRSRVQGTYLHADEDRHGVSLSGRRESTNEAWVVRIYHGVAGDSYILLQSAAYGRYLAATDAPASHGHLGFRAEQRDYARREVEPFMWQAVGADAGNNVLIRNVAGRYLRANGSGGYLSWNNGVSVDDFDNVSTMMHWVVEPLPGSPRPPCLTEVQPTRPVQVKFEWPQAPEYSAARSSSSLATDYEGPTSNYLAMNGKESQLSPTVSPLCECHCSECSLQKQVNDDDSSWFKKSETYPDSERREKESVTVSLQEEEQKSHTQLGTSRGYKLSTSSTNSHLIYYEERACGSRFWELNKPPEDVPGINLPGFFSHHPVWEGFAVPVERGGRVDSFYCTYCRKVLLGSADVAVKHMALRKGCKITEEDKWEVMTRVKAYREKRESLKGKLRARYDGARVVPENGKGADQPSISSLHGDPAESFLGDRIRSGGITREERALHSETDEVERSPAGVEEKSQEAEGETIL